MEELHVPGGKKTDRILSGVENPSLPGLTWVPGQMVDPLAKKKRNLWTLGGVSQ